MWIPFLLHCLVTSLASGAAITAALVVTGFVSWQFIEYCIHRFAFHSIPGMARLKLPRLMTSTRTAGSLLALLCIPSQLLEGLCSCQCTRCKKQTSRNPMQSLYAASAFRNAECGTHLAVDGYWGITAHFLFHGCHHKYPLDATRLVFPPVPAAAVAAGIVAVLRLVLAPVSDLTQQISCFHAIHQKLVFSFCCDLFYHKSFRMS